MTTFLRALILCSLIGLLTNSSEAQSLSHPPRHTPLLSSTLPIPKGPVYHVDSSTGDDSAPGSEAKPWRSIQQSLEKLRPGDTLLLRGGVFHENVYCSVAGTPDKPITIRSYPGETAIIDGGISEFALNPQTAWEPGEADGEYVSTKEYRNIRDVLGLFGDSNIGLQTYWHREYLIASNELAGVNPETGKAEPYYCGPGLFYNRATGKIHARLAPTTIKSKFIQNYRGESDPRKLPLIIAPFRSTPLHLDQAMHVRFQNIVVRGGGLNTVMLTFAVDVEFDYITVFGGSYCIRGKNSGPVKITNSGIYGQIPPWGFRTENALGTYDPVFYDPYTQPPEPRPNRNIARLPTHALLVTEGAEESDIFAYPYNNRWEIAQCEFADGHDGIYLNGRNMWIHHSWIFNMQDDAVYLSSPTPQVICDDVHISQNFIAKNIIPFGGHTRGAVDGNIYVYGNVVDMRPPPQYQRPTFEKPEGTMVFPNLSGAFFLIHGRNELIGMENIGFYYNTAIVPPRSYAGSATGRTFPKTARSIYNNLFVYSQGLPVKGVGIANGLLNLDGNLHWSTSKGDEINQDWIRQVTDSKGSLENVEKWKGTQWETHSRYGDPKFLQFDIMAEKGNDYRLGKNSAALGCAVDFSQKAHLRWEFPGQHAGAIQSDEPLRVGINRRMVAGETERP